MADFRLTVLNPGGRDPAQDFSGGNDRPNDHEHAPVNFHGYAACTRGCFLRETKAARAAGRPVLLLLRGDFRQSQRALVELHRAKLPVVLSLKETGLHQAAAQLRDAKRAARFHHLVQLADDCLGATPEVLAFYRRGEFIPTPYPLSDSRWDFSRSPEERAGIFVGTREWDVPSRHHLAALLLALGTGEPVTVFDQNPKRCRATLKALGAPLRLLRIIERRLPYRDYLAEMARHRFVLQADRSAVPGQVAGDALLCRIPCVGGDGTIDRIAFPRTCGFGRSLGELASLARQLSSDTAFYAEIVYESQQLARERLSFEVVAGQLAEFFGRLTR